MSKNNYKFGKGSLRELVGVHPYLAFAAQKAIERTEFDFGVFDGVRTAKEQRKLVARGTSKTSNSYHLYGLAIDLVPYFDSKYNWDGKRALKYFNEIAKVMNDIIKEYDLPIKHGFAMWGWDRAHWEMTGYQNKYDVRKLT